MMRYVVQVIIVNTIQSSFNSQVLGWVVKSEIQYAFHKPSVLLYYVCIHTYMSTYNFIYIYMYIHKYTYI
jgi:hypothetical protein